MTADELRALHEALPADAWALVEARYADGYEGHDIVCCNDAQDDVIEKVPEVAGRLIVALRNAYAEGLLVWKEDDK